MFYNLKTPKMKICKFAINELGDISNDLCSRQVITIPFNNNFFEETVLNDITNRDFYDNLNVEDIEDDVDSYKDIGCYYLCSSDMFIVSNNYLKYIKAKKPNLIKIMIFGIEHGYHSKNKYLLDLISTKVELPKLNNLHIDINYGKIKYPIYSKDDFKKITNNDIDYYIYSTNVPYEYYKKIHLIDSVFTYDIDSHIFFDEDYKISNIFNPKYYIDKYIENIKKKDYPIIYVYINNNNILPFPYTSSNYDLLVAKLLKIPMLPMNFVLVDSMTKYHITKKYKSDITIAETNSICNPYFKLGEDD